MNGVSSYRVSRGVNEKGEHVKKLRSTKRRLDESEYAQLAEQGTGGAPSKAWTFYPENDFGPACWERGPLRVGRRDEEDGWWFAYVIEGSPFKMDKGPKPARTLMLAADKWAAENPEEFASLEDSE